MQFVNFTPLQGKLVQVVVETPKGSQHKYTFDTELQIFRLKKSLPMGTVFPFDFGFIPNTIGEDGDPIDVLILMDQPAYPGCITECRLLGVLLANQKDHGGKVIRNDRIIAVSTSSVLFAGIKKIEDLNKNMGQEIENFFIDYNKRIGKKFAPIKFAGTKSALKLIGKGMQASGKKT